LKDEELDRCQWRTRFGRGYGPDLMTASRMNEGFRREVAENCALLGCYAASS